MHSSLGTTLQEAFSGSSPERRLLASILARAIADALPTTSESFGNCYWRADAMCWMQSKSEKEFSFIWLCQHLELDHEFVLKFIFKSLANDEKYYNPKDPRFEAIQDRIAKDKIPGRRRISGRRRRRLKRKKLAEQLNGEEESRSPLQDNPSHPGGDTRSANIG